jgi:hypothetical protein
VPFYRNDVAPISKKRWNLPIYPEVTRIYLNNHKRKIQDEGQLHMRNKRLNILDHVLQMLNTIRGTNRQKVG